MFDHTMFDKKPNRPRSGGCSTAILLIVLLLVTLIISSCSAADTASYNLSKRADAFQVTRRIIFYNGITGDYMLQVEGLCSIGNSDIAGEISITCKVGPEQYKKHYLGLSDNVTYFVEQIDSISLDPYHYLVIFRPSVIIPDIELDIP